MLFGRLSLLIENQTQTNPSLPADHVERAEKGALKGDGGRLPERGSPYSEHCLARERCT